MSKHRVGGCCGDVWDWHGCEAICFDPEKLGGRAAVLDTRLDADTVLICYQDGMRAEEISEEYQTDLAAIQTVIAFALARQLKAIA